MARLEDRVSGWWVFAGVLLLIGVLNVIWGIACSSACSVAHRVLAVLRRRLRSLSASSPLR